MSIRPLIQELLKKVPLHESYLFVSLKLQLYVLNGPVPLLEWVFLTLCRLRSGPTTFAPETSNVTPSEPESRFCLLLAASDPDWRGRLAEMSLEVEDCGPSDDLHYALTCVQVPPSGRPQTFLPKGLVDILSLCPQEEPTDLPLRDLILTNLHESRGKLTVEEILEWLQCVHLVDWSILKSAAPQFLSALSESPNRILGGSAEQRKGILGWIRRTNNLLRAHGLIDWSSSADRLRLSNFKQEGVLQCELNEDIVSGIYYRIYTSIQCGQEMPRMLLYRGIDSEGLLSSPQLPSDWLEQLAGLVRSLGVIIFRYSVASLFRPYLGESEALTRQLFKEISTTKIDGIVHTLLVLDGLHLVGKKNEDNEVNRRIVTTLLNCLDGIDTAQKPIVIGLTDVSPELMTESLVRPGRFDVWLQIN